MRRIRPEERAAILETLPKEKTCLYCGAVKSSAEFVLYCLKKPAYPEGRWSLRGFCRECYAAKMRVMRAQPGYREAEKIKHRVWRRANRAVVKRLERDRSVRKNAWQRAYGKRRTRARHDALAARIPGAIAAVYGVADPTRHDYAFEARLVHIWMLKVVCRRTVNEIARHFGYDHSTVCHHIERIRSGQKTDHELAWAIRAVRVRLTGPYARMVSLDIVPPAHGDGRQRAYQMTGRVSLPRQETAPCTSTAAR